MVYITGDIHGVPWKIYKYAKRLKMTEEDVIVILGDVGANYYGGPQDRLIKRTFRQIKPTILCIHGNHEKRPHTLACYNLKEWNGGKVWVEDEFPNILFAKDGEIYNLDGLQCIAIGGAYSVDKYFRLARGTGWWEDEQPSEEIKRFVEEQLKCYSVDVIFSHTCPFRYEPREMFLPMVDQSTVDDSTERWLDEIEAATDYKAWFCGHWHTDKRIDKIHFLYNGWEILEDVETKEGGD